MAKIKYIVSVVNNKFKNTVVCFMRHDTGDDEFSFSLPSRLFNELVDYVQINYLNYKVKLSDYLDLPSQLSEKERKGFATTLYYVYYNSPTTLGYDNYITGVLVDQGFIETNGYYWTCTEKGREVVEKIDDIL
jgi:hypothetical protein